MGICNYCMSWQVCMNLYDLISMKMYDLLVTRHHEGSPPKPSVNQQLQ